MVEDEELKWEHITTAKHNLLNAITAWPEKLKLSLASFYLNLEALGATTANPRALVLYQATARRQWHAALKKDSTMTPFNISHINLELLTCFENQIRDHDYAALDKKASISSNSLKSSPH